MDAGKTGAYLAALRKARGMTQQEAIKPIPRRGITATQFPRGPVSRPPPDPPAGNCMERNQPLTPPCAQLSDSTKAPPVAGHPFPRPHSKPHSKQQKLANFSCADIINSDTS